MVPVVYTIAGELQPSLLDHLEAAAHISSGLNGPTPDIQLALVTVRVPTKLLDKGQPVYTRYASLLSPRSRGTVKLAAASARTTPLVDPAFFSDPADLDTLQAGVRIAREGGAAESLSYWRKDEGFPGTLGGVPEGRSAYIRLGYESQQHPVGTCRIGTSPTDVVDPELRVHGISGLRVVDASVMPSVPAANPHATVLAIAEKAADLIRITA